MGNGAGALEVERGAGADALACAPRLTEIFVSRLRDVVPAAAISVVVDHASLRHIPHVASWAEMRARVLGVADVVAGTLPRDTGTTIALTVSGVRSSGSVHIAVAVSGGRVMTDGRLRVAVDELGGAVLDIGDEHLVVALYPQSIAHSSPV